MNNNEEQLLIKQLNSSDSEERILAWRELYAVWRDDFYGYFSRNSLNHQDADDLAQELYFKIEEYLEAHQLQGANPKGFVWTTAKHMQIDHYRGQDRRLRKEVSWDSLDDWKQTRFSYSETVLQEEDSFFIKEYAKRAYDLVLGLPEMRDRLAVLLAGAGYKSEHIPTLMPSLFRSTRTVQRRLKNSRDIIKQKLKYAGENLHCPSSWEKKPSFIDGVDSFGFNYLNNLPMDLAPESKHELCRFLNLDTFDQLAELYLALLVFHGIGTSALETRLCFVPRVELSWGVLSGDRLHYLDTTPTFHRVKVNGGGQEMLFLENLITYSGKMTGKQENESGHLVVTKWVYSFSNGATNVYKAFDPQILTFYGNPQTRENLLFAFHFAQNINPN